MWTHLSRQTGGIGTRGPGETQLEVDRRRVQERIARLERDLEEVRKHRAVQRQGRKRHQWPVAAVVGYTNAGKSTLLNLLTGADVLAEDKLFATLDPTTRSLILPNKQRVLLTDTVGFLRKLPHTLIESFKATLEEVVEADLLIHVVDLSHPRVDEHMAAVDTVIKEIGAYGKQTLMVFNKIDALSDRDLIQVYLEKFPGSVAISARTGEGIADLVPALQETLSSWRLRCRYKVPQSESALIAEVHRVGHVLELRYDGEFAEIVAHVPPQLEQKLAPYLDPRARRQSLARLTNGELVCAMGKPLWPDQSASGEETDCRSHRYYRCVVWRGFDRLAGARRAGRAARTGDSRHRIRLGTTPHSAGRRSLGQCSPPLAVGQAGATEVVVRQ